MTPRILNKRTASAAELRDAVYVGRPTKYGNPYSIGAHGNREQVIVQFQRWWYAPEQEALRLEAFRELRGRDLVCWCAPKHCHAEVIAAFVNVGLDVGGVR